MNRLLVFEFGNAGAESKNRDDAHSSVGLDESGRPIFTMLVEQPVFAHNQLSLPRQFGVNRTAAQPMWSIFRFVRQTGSQRRASCLEQ